MSAAPDGVDGDVDGRVPHHLLCSQVFQLLGEDLQIFQGVRVLEDVMTVQAAHAPRLRSSPHRASHRPLVTGPAGDEPHQEPEHPPHGWR